MYFNFKSLRLMTILLIISSDFVFPYNNGVSGRTQVGCTCHSLSPNGATTVTAQSSSGNFRTRPGQSLNISITVANSLMRAAGINIAVTNQNGQNAGILTPGTNSGLQSSGGELTHTTPKAMNNGEATFDFSWTSPSSGGEYTLRAVGNAVNSDRSTGGDAWNYLSAVTISVANIVVIAPNGGESWCLGSTQNITWTSSFVQEVEISFSSDGGNSWLTLASNIPAQQGSWVWNIPNNLQAGSQYKIKISDVTDSTLFDESNGNFSLTSAPRIVQQLSSLEVCEGQLIKLLVTAEGTGLNYQWRKDASPIAGATQSTYETTATLASAGVYDCVVSNSCGTVTSDTARVSVNEQPKITVQPLSLEVCAGSDAIFSVEASGTGIQYQWRKNGSSITGANSNTLTIRNVQLSDSGTYDVVINGVCSPSAQSQPAKLTVLKPVTILYQPKPSTVKVGQSVTFSIDVKGAEPINYQWRKNGNPIENANGSSYTITSVQITDAGYYDCVVSNQCDTITSQVVQLVVTLLKSPVLTLRDTLWDFGAEEVGDTMIIAQMGFIRNAGEDTLRITKIEIIGPDSLSYVLLSGNPPVILAPNESHSLEIRFIPAHPGEHNATMTFVSNSSVSPELRLKGIGLLPEISALEESLDFGDIELNSAKVKSIKLVNIGLLSVFITALELSDESFEIIQQPVLPYLLHPGDTLQLRIGFAPTEAKDYFADLIVSYIGKIYQNELQIRIVGRGYSPTLVDEIVSLRQILVSPNPASDDVQLNFSFDKVPKSIEIVDVNGFLVIKFVNFEAGQSSILWDGTNIEGTRVASGLYFVRVYLPEHILIVPLLYTR